MCNLCTTFSINLYSSFAFLCFCFILFSFFLWVGSFSRSPLTKGGPPQCLNSGPGSEPGGNRGLGFLFWGYASNLSYFPFLFALCFRPVPPHSPQGYALPRSISFLGTFLCVLLHREPLPLLAPCLLQI